MTEIPKRPADTGHAESSRSAKTVRPTSPADDTAQPADSVPLPVGPFNHLPTTFGRYRLEKLLGRGSMGAVYLAHDTQLDRPVALKVARVSAAGSGKLIKRMETEARAAAKIDHPLICKVFDFGEIEGIRFITLQYIEGEDLKSHLKRVGRKREPAQAIRWITQIASALASAHDKGIIHRDLKPENIMLNRNGDPVIMDFGLARSTMGSSNAGLTQGMIVGTAAYMSPEQATGKADEIDHRSDLYAIGVMLFEMLTGEWPFDGAAIEVMGRKCVLDPPSPVERCPDLHPQLAKVCHTLIAKSKNDRYSSCHQIVAALAAIDLNAPVTIPLQPAVASTSSGAPVAPLDFLSNIATESTVRTTKSTPPPVPPPVPSSTKPRKTAGVTKDASKASRLNVPAWVPAAAVAGAVLAVGLVWQFVFASPNPRLPEVAQTKPELATQMAPPTLPAEQQPPSVNPMAQLADATRRNATGSRPNPQPPSKVDGVTAPPSQLFNQPSPEIAAETLPPSSAQTPPKSEENSVLMTDDESSENAKDNLTAANTDVDTLIATSAALMKAMNGKGNPKSFKEAIQPLRKASNLFPKEIRPDFYLGLVHSGIGVNDPKVAEVHFQRVLERSPGHVPTLNNLALVEVKGKDLRPARNYFTLAANQKPRASEVNQNLGRLLEQAKVFNLKGEELKRITALNTESSGYRANVGWLYMPADNSEKSLTEYKSFCRNGRLEDVSCSICNGAASLPCTNCNRNGSVLLFGSFAETKNLGFGTVTVSSPTSATMTCRACGGRGRIDCPGCKDGHDPKLRLR